MQVDVVSRLGALSAPTTTGFRTLDSLLVGGLRTGVLVSISGGPGVGKTAFALLAAYMAARSKAAVLFTSASLDTTEVLARLGARALFREYPDAETSYGDIWSGEALQDPVLHGPVRTSVDTAVQKVGDRLHLHAAKPFESSARLEALVSQLWARYDRVVLVVDGLEAYSSQVSRDTTRAAAANSGLENRVAMTSFALRDLADHGCAVLTTCDSTSAPMAQMGATLAAELRRRPGVDDPKLGARERSQGGHRIDLVVTKNRIGPHGAVPLIFVPGASIFEEAT